MTTRGAVMTDAEVAVEIKRRRAEVERRMASGEVQAPRTLTYTKPRAPWLALVGQATMFMRHAPTCHHACDEGGELTNAYRILGPCDCGRDACIAELEAALRR